MTLQKNPLTGTLLLLLSIALLHLPVRAAAPVETCPMPVNVYPADAYPVPQGGSQDMQVDVQKALDDHGSIRLLPGTYKPVTIHDGQQIYGLPGVKIAQITVEPGASGVLVSGIEGNVLFPVSNAVTHHNTIFRIRGTVIVQGGMLEDNLFVDTRGLDVDVSKSGYLRNNRFIRAPGQMQGSGMLKFRASPDRPSGGNTFLWANAGGNDGPTTDIDGVPDLTIAVVDAEMWSQKTPQPTALFVTGRMERLNLFAVQGGRYDKDPDFRKASGLVNSAAREVRVFGLTCGYRGQTPDLPPAKIALRDGNERSFFAGCLPYSYSLPSTSVLSVQAFDQTRGVEGLQAKPPGTSPVVFTPSDAEQNRQSALRNMILQSGRQMVPWERPSFGPVPDPSGKIAADPADQTKMLQDRLDKEGMVVLPPGRFYISAPLRINGAKGLIGAGMDKTFILAKDPQMSMFIYDPAGRTRGITLANLTAKGGRVGVHIRGSENPDQPLNGTFISSVTFRNFSEAGVFVDLADAKAASFDNNMIAFCNFVQCGAGLKQNPPQTGGWGFIDKLVTYRCQFLQCGIGVDFPAARSNNACAWIECVFQGNTTAAVMLRHNTTPAFANCDFIGNAGNPVVSSDDFTYFLSCRFEAAAGSSGLLPRKTCAEGCTFESGDSQGCVVVGEADENHFYNCTVKIPAGPLNNGLLLNNDFADREDLSQLGISLIKGQPTVFAPGTPRPGPQILVSDGSVR